MQFFEDLFDRMDDGELRPSDIFTIGGLIFAALLIVFALLVSVFFALYILFTAILSDNMAKLLILIPCALVFAVSASVMICVAIFLENHL